MVCVYSPTNSSSLDKIEDSYTTLFSTVEQVSLHNFLVLAGDLNAKLGLDEARFSFNSKTNQNGEMLIDFIEEFNLSISNTSFIKPKRQMWIFEYPSGVRAQLDYLIFQHIFRKKWRSSVKNSRTYSSLSSVDSNHRIVSSTIKLSLCSSKKVQSRPMKRKSRPTPTGPSSLLLKSTTNFNHYAKLISILTTSTKFIAILLNQLKRLQWLLSQEEEESLKKTISVP